MDFILDETSVSRHHANLHNSPDGIVWVIDLGSTNGTKLEGQPVRDWTRVEPGQVITFGDIDVRLEDELYVPNGDAAHNGDPADQRPIPAELGPNPTASGKLPKVNGNPDSASIATPANLLAVKPKKASGIVLPPRSSLSAQISPPGEPQKKLVSRQGKLANGNVSAALETLELPNVRRRANPAQQQVDSLVQRANAIAQSTPPERNTGQVFHDINADEKNKRAEQNKQTDGVRVPPPRSPRPVAQPIGAHDDTELPEDVNGHGAVAAAGGYGHAALAPNPTPVAAAPSPRPHVQPAPAEPAPVRQPIPPMAKMTPQPAATPVVEAPAQAAAPAAQMVKASEVAFYKSMAFLALGLFLGFAGGLVAAKFLLPML